jgi:hypothetical protein
MPSPGALLVGLLVAAPAVYGALVTGTVSVDAALQRLVVVLVGMSVATAAVQRLWRTYGAHTPAPVERPSRRRDDPPSR